MRFSSGASNGRSVRLIAGGAAVCLFALVSCTSGGAADGTSAVGPTTSASAPAPGTGSASAGPAATETGTGTASSGNGAATTGSARPAALDPTSVTWFDTLCQKLGPALILDVAGGALPTDDFASQQDAAVAALDTVSRAYADAGVALAATPPPGIDGGAEFAARVSAAFGASSAELAESMADVTAMDPAAPDATATLLASLSAARDTAGAPVSLLLELPPEVQAATAEIPSCDFVAGS